LSKRIRVIPVLSIDNGQLVKTIKFKNPNYLGDPINAIKILNDKSVDEVAVVDIRASYRNKEPDYNLIAEMAGECFMPLAYGGGVTTFAMAKKIFELGVEKIIINTANQNDFSLVKEIAATYGDQSVVGSLDIGESFFKKKQLKFNSGTQKSKAEIVDFAVEMTQNGVGEILINSIDRDGTFKGYDVDLIREIAQKVSVPVVAYGGASSISDFVEVVSKGKASAVAASSMFVYKNNNTESILNIYTKQTQLI
jgi:cyclase